MRVDAMRRYGPEAESGECATAANNGSSLSFSRRGGGDNCQGYDIGRAMPL